MLLSKLLKDLLDFEFTEVGLRVSDGVGPGRYVTVSRVLGATSTVG